MNDRYLDISSENDSAYRDGSIDSLLSIEYNIVHVVLVLTRRYREID